MDKSIVVENWIIRSQHRPILNEDEHDAFVEWLRKRGGEHIRLFRIHPCTKHNPLSVLCYVVTAAGYNILVYFLYLIASPIFHPEVPVWENRGAHLLGHGVT